MTDKFIYTSNYRGLEMINQHRNGQHKVGNVNVQIGSKKGYYVGSASNMARLFIMISVIFGLVMSGACFYFASRLSIAEYKISNLESKVLK